MRASASLAILVYLAASASASPMAVNNEERGLKFTQSQTVAASMEGHGYGVQAYMGTFGQSLNSGLHFLDGTLLISYNEKNSLTYKQGATTPTGNASNAKDTFALGLTLYSWSNMDFLNVDADSQFFPVWHGAPLVPATIGFGFNNDRTEDGLGYGPSWWRQAATQSWPQPTIGLYIAPVYNALNVTHLNQIQTQRTWLLGGSVMWGGTDSYYMDGQPNWLGVLPPVVSTEQNWLFSGDGLKVDDAAVPLSAALTFTPFLAPWVQLPASVAAALHQPIAGSYAVPVTSDQGDMVQYAVPCGTKNVITLTLGGVDYPIPASLWVKRNAGGDPNMCTSAFQTIPTAFGDGPYFMQLGTTFLSTVYTVMKLDVANDKPVQIGFAKTKCGRLAIDGVTGFTKFTQCKGGLLGWLASLF